MRRWQVLVGVGMIGLAATAAAQAPYVAIEQRVDPQALAEVGLSPIQLQTLNRLLSEAEQRAPVASVATEPASAPAPAAAPMFAGLDEGSIEAHATGTIEGWQPGTVFSLDNGQQWQVLKGEMKLRKPVSNPAIVVVPGIAGRWFLQMDEDLPKARVHRIR